MLGFFNKLLNNVFSFVFQRCLSLTIKSVKMSMLHEWTATQRNHWKSIEIMCISVLLKNMLSAFLRLIKNSLPLFFSFKTTALDDEKYFKIKQFNSLKSHSTQIWEVSASALYSFSHSCSQVSCQCFYNFRFYIHCTRSGIPYRNTLHIG